ncbi:MAG: hypothetical protein L3K05_00010 [Thermoplasmata archaeon]|nr:hypothetical protein [Thermoplasmata archaeon]
MATAQQLGKAGYKFVSNGQFYPGPNPGELLEVDVTGSMEFARPSGAESIHLALVIECKYGADTPWVNLIGETDISFVWLPTAAFATAAARPWLDSSAEAMSPLKGLTAKGFGDAFGYRILPYLPTLAEPRNPAKSKPGTQRRSRDPEVRPEEVPYWAIDRCLRGAAARARLGRTPGTSEFPPWEVIHPVVVFDGDLFECRVGAGGKPKAKRVQSTKVLRETLEADNRRIVVSVVSAKNFVSWAKHEAEEFRALVGAWSFLGSGPPGLLSLPPSGTE